MNTSLSKQTHLPEMKTDNELIAEFMGAELKKLDSTFIKFVSGSPINVWKFPESFNNEFVPKIIREDALKFDTSWDWLMPVVEKIGKVDNDVFYKFTDETHCSAPSVFDSIQEVYDFVMEFINWYNTQKELVTN